MLFFAIAVLYELLYLAFQFIFTTIESWYLTVFPRKMKSLAGEIILVRILIRVKLQQNPDIFKQLEKSSVSRMLHGEN